ncbi:MAG: deoxyribonuclease [Desulfurococcaceae archaeon]
MSRSTRKQHWNPYTSDIRRLSIYPQINTRETPSLRVGEEITVNIYDIDDKGRGLVNYKGVKIIIPNATSGSRVRVKIVKIMEDTAIGYVTKILSESAD